MDAPRLTGPIAAASTRTTRRGVVATDARLADAAPTVAATFDLAAGARLRRFR